MLREIHLIVKLSEMLKPQPHSILCSFPGMDTPTRDGAPSSLSYHRSLKAKTPKHFKPGEGFPTVPLVHQKKCLSEP